MASSWLRMPRIFLTRASGSRIPQLAIFAFAERARIRTFHSQQQHQKFGRGVFSCGTRRFLAYTACISVAGFGYALYKWRDDIRQEIERFVPNYPGVHAISSNSSPNRDRYNFIADAVEMCAPAVVYIEIKAGSSTTFGRLLTNTGSGFIISQDGLILTNAHVVVNAPVNTSVKVNVRLHDGSIYAGIIEHIDLQSDLATIRINKTNLPVMKLGSSADIRPGEFVIAIGSPLNLSNTITSGVVSSVNRPSQELGLDKQHMGYIQTDAGITFGNSGGPLVNLNGEVIGINAMNVMPGISFAIPIDHAKEFLKKADIRKKNEGITVVETYGRKYMGIRMLTLTPEMVHMMKQCDCNYMDVQHGVFIFGVMLGSPAHQAGLQPGDIVTHANNEPVLNSNNIYEILKQPGNIKLQVLRKGQILRTTIYPELI